MDLLLSVSALGGASVLTAVVLIGVRNPRQPLWASDWLVANVWLILIIGMGTFGVAYAIRFAVTINAQSLGMREIGLSLAIAALTALVIWLLASRRRLSAYAAAEAAPKTDTGGGSPRVPGLEKAA